MNRHVRARLESQVAALSEPEIKSLEERAEEFRIPFGEWRGDSPLRGQKNMTPLAIFVSLCVLAAFVAVAAFDKLISINLIGVAGGFRVSFRAISQRRSYRREKRLFPKEVMGAFPVYCRIEQLEWPVGEDVGWLWAEDGLLRFEGVVSSWAIPRRGMTLQGQKFTIQSQNPVLDLKLADRMTVIVEPMKSFSTTHLMEDLFLRLNKQRLRCPESAVLPPRTIQPSCRVKIEKGIERRNQRKLPVVFAVLIVVAMVALFALGIFLPKPYDIWAVILLEIAVVFGSLILPAMRGNDHLRGNPLHVLQDEWDEEKELTASGAEPSEGSEGQTFAGQS